MPDALELPFWNGIDRGQLIVTDVGRVLRSEEIELRLGLNFARYAAAMLPPPGNQLARFFDWLNQRAMEVMPAQAQQEVAFGPAAAEQPQNAAPAPHTWGTPFEWAN